jgi:phenylacetate-coenzyme A ligase PaaK-like adenylate-forming protein
VFFLAINGLFIFFDFVVKQRKTGSLRERLQYLLESSLKHEFFKERIGSFLEKNKDVNDEEFFKNWKELPILTKPDYVYINIEGKYPKISNNFFVALYQLWSGRFTYQLATGGSSKLPLTVSMDKQHAFKMAFSFFLCWYKMGWRPGQKILIYYPDKIYDLEVFKHYRVLFDWIGVRFHTFSKIDVEDFIKQLNSYQPSILIIFPSPLNILSNKIHKKNLASFWQPKFINVSGETLFKCQRDNIQRIFYKSKLDDSYGSVELGEIAHEKYPGLLEVFDHHVFVETIDAEDGKKEMIATVFGNGYFPFIRYKMGDLMNIIEKDGKQYLCNIDGKASNKMKLGKEIIYPRDLDKCITEINKVLNPKYPVIIDARLIKDEHTITLSIILSGKIHKLLLNVVEHKAQQVFKERFGTRPNIDFVEIFKHDYRLKYRALVDKKDEHEWAGGIIGQEDKMRL